MGSQSIIQTKGDVIVLTKAQEAFLNFCQEVGYATLEVQVKNGQPIMSKVIEQWRKHD